MRRTAFGLGVCVLAGLFAFGCKAQNAEVRELSVAEAARAHADQKTVFVDANVQEYRESQGVVPGAILLPEDPGEITSVLPADKDTPLVFYCINRF